MLIDITVPSVGESVTEATLGQWYKIDGDPVRKNEPLFVLETDKVTLEIEAEADGALRIDVAEGETVAIGTVVGTIDTEAAPEMVEEAAPGEVPEIAPTAPPPPAEPAAVEPAVEIPLAAEPALAPSVRRLVAEKTLDVSKITGTGPRGRITKGDVILYLEQAALAQPPVAAVTQPALLVFQFQDQCLAKTFALPFPGTALQRYPRSLLLTKLMKGADSPVRFSFDPRRQKGPPRGGPFAAATGYWVCVSIA